MDGANWFMIITFLITLSVFGLMGAVLWPIILRDLIIVNFGILRTLQPISDFPYECRRISGPGLEACEDMWLSERSRKLFLACSTSLSRKDWMPNIQRLNVTGRSLEDKIIALDIDKPIDDGFEYLEIPGFSNPDTDVKPQLVGLTGVDRADHVELYFVNNQPSLNLTTGEFLDQKEVGANSTIEHYRVNLDTQEVQFVRTYYDPAIVTPNNIATRGDGSFHFTNDHGRNKVGLGHEFSPIKGDGDVSYCNEGGCRRVSSGHAFPNGLSFGADGLLYVPSSFSGDLKVYIIQPDGGVKKIDKVYVPYPLDNLSLDADGDLWVAGLPDMKESLDGFNDPLGKTPPATILRIHKKPNGEYEVDKVLEDKEGKVLPAATSVIHDVKTGRIFASGVFSPFITVCEPKGLPASGKTESQTLEHEEL